MLNFVQTFMGRNNQAVPAGNAADDLPPAQGVDVAGDAHISALSRRVCSANRTVVVDGQALLWPPLWSRLSTALKLRGMTDAHLGKVARISGQILDNGPYEDVDALADSLVDAFNHKFATEYAEPPTHGPMSSFLRALMLQSAIVPAMQGLPKISANGSACAIAPVPPSAGPLTASFQPPPDAEVYSNRADGYVKDWMNALMGAAPLSYAEDPRTQGAQLLESGARLSDGIYNFAYRRHDNRCFVIKHVRAPNGMLVSPLAHSYLASGRSTYVSGEMTVRNGAVTRANTLSGHFRPQPSRYVDPSTCRIETRPGEGLNYFGALLGALGLRAPDFVAAPATLPGVHDEQQWCFAGKRKNNPNYYKF